MKNRDMKKPGIKRSSYSDKVVQLKSGDETASLKQRYPEILFWNLAGIKSKLPELSGLAWQICIFENSQQISNYLMKNGEHLVIVQIPEHVSKAQTEELENVISQGAATWIALITPLSVT